MSLMNDDDFELEITSIKEISGKRRLIYINYEPAFALYISEIKRFSIKQDSILDKSDYSTIVNDILCKRARIRAMALLKSRDYSESGLEKKLKEGWYPQEAIESAIDYVKSYGYIDDNRYAANYIFYHAPSKSRKQIENLLYQKGSPADIIDSECENYYSENDDVELEQVIKLLNKKLLNKDKDYENISKAKAYLYRKGFNIDIINKAVFMLEN